MFGSLTSRSIENAMEVSDHFPDAIRTSSYLGLVRMKTRIDIPRSDFALRDSVGSHALP